MSQKDKQSEGAKYGLVRWAAGGHDNQTWPPERHPQRAHEGEKERTSDLRELIYMQTYKQ